MTEINDQDYGFFCDLETAKTMEYEKVEYYVVKVSTKYEVRKKPIELGEIPPNRIRISELGDDLPSLSSSNSCCCINIQNQEGSEKTQTTCFLLRLPRDIYYSFMLCTVTASCVYMVMTISN